MAGLAASRVEGFCIPGDRNHLTRELSLAGAVAPDTRRPPGLARSEGIEAPSRLRGAATLSPKAALRRWAAERRLSLARDLPDAGDRAAAALPEDLLRGVRAAALYRPMRGELETAPLARRLREAGIEILLPAVVGRGLPLAFRRDDGPLEPDAAGLPAPPPGAPQRRPDLIFAPLLAFDGAGARLGWGGGYYDRTLAALRGTAAPHFVGLAFSLQEVEAVPAQPHDARLDAVLTERGYRAFEARNT